MSRKYFVVEVDDSDTKNKKELHYDRFLKRIEADGILRKNSKIIDQAKYDQIFKLLNGERHDLSSSQAFYYKNGDFQLVNRLDKSVILGKRVYEKQKDAKSKDKSKYSVLEVVPKEKFFDTIYYIHAILRGHCGMNKTVHQICERYASIPRHVIEIYCQLCPVCLLKVVQTTQPRLRPIRSDGFWSHTQIDLIDMRHNPSDGYKYICHLEDHFSKYHVLWKMKQKCADEVLAGLYEKVFPYFGIPKIFQSDNGLEFKNSKVVNLINNWDGDCDIRYGRPRHPQSQGLIEQANGTTQRMLSSLVQQHKICQDDKSGNILPILKDGNWANLLPLIMYNLNTQLSTSLKTTPYEVVFAQKPNMGSIKLCNVEKDKLNDPASDNDAVYDDISERESESESESESDGETRSSASSIRERVSSQQAINAIIMEKKHNHKRNKRTREFEIDEFVSVLIPRIDRGGSDLPRLPGQVVRISGDKDKFYEVATEYGILDSKYRSSELELYESTVNINKNITISLTTAAGKAQIRTAPENSIEKPVSCKCIGKCDGRCKCRQSKQKCTSHCHKSASNSCTNK